MFVQSVLKVLPSWFIIFPSLFLAGYQFRSFIQVKNEILRGVLFYAIGMAIFSYSVIVLSALHLLNSAVIWTALTLFLLSQVRLISAWTSWLNLVFSDLTSSRNKFERLCQIFFAIAFLALFIGALSPELGGDALCYQLNLPKIFLAKGSVAPIYYDVNSYFPLFMNYLYLIGIATGGMLSAKLFHVLTGFLLFLVLKIKINEEIKNKGWAYFFALVFFATPVVYNMLSTTYVDVGLALYVFLSFVSMQEGFRSRQLKTLFLSGFLLGCGISIKYLGLVSALGLAGIFVWENISVPISVWVKRFLAWVGGCGLGFGYWVIRNWFITGNPLYPYLGSFFKTESIPGMKYDQVGVGYGFFDFVGIFWNMFINPVAFGTYSDRIGIFYLLLIPFALLAIFFVPKSRSYAIFLAIFLSVWFFICQAGRYLIPAMPFMILAGAMGLQWVLKRLPSILKSVFTFGSCMILSAYLLIGVAHYRYSYLLMAGKWSWNDYLFKLERTSEIAFWVNDHLDKNAKILLAREPRQFYFDRPLLRDVALRYRTHYDQNNLNLKSYSGFLKNEKVTHILMSKPLTETSGGADPNPLLDELVSSKQVQLIHEVTSKNIRDTRYIFRLYELK